MENKDQEILNLKKALELAIKALNIPEGFYPDEDCPGYKKITELASEITNLEYRLAMKDEIIKELELKLYEKEKPKQKLIKKTVCITADLNEQAEKLGINFSRTLRDALKIEIERLED